MFQIIIDTEHIVPDTVDDDFHLILDLGGLWVGAFVDILFLCDDESCNIYPSRVPNRNNRRVLFRALFLKFQGD